MLRPLLLVPALATLVVAALPASAPAASPEAGPIVRVELDLKASNGLHAHLETSEKQMVTLHLERDHREGVAYSEWATYEVQGEVTEAGLKVRFGRLGLIDVAFTPTKTLSSTEPSEGCTGASRTLREGVFTGTIDFTGEGEFVHLEGPQAEGSMSVISQWQCPEDPAFSERPFAALSRRLALRPRDENEKGTLSAYNLRCLCFFAVGIRHRGKGGRSIFAGGRAEIREGMTIFRGTVAHTGASAFAFDHAAGTATVRPPPPFSGHATFRSRSHARPFWRSTIRVPLLGADSFGLTGPGFRVELHPEYQF